MDAPRLEHLAEIEGVLSDYQISERAKGVLKDLELALLVGVTSSGRNTIIKELVKTGYYQYLVSDTTRKPQVRDGQIEEHGVTYYFRSEEEVLADLKSGEFLEAAIIHDQQVSGISIRELERAKNSNKIAVTDTELVGAQNIIEAKPDTLVIFVLPPTFEAWQHRFEHRGELSDLERKNRMRSALREIEGALEKDYYHFIVNDSLDSVAKRVDGLIRLDIPDKEYQEFSHQAARNLLADSRKNL